MRFGVTGLANEYGYYTLGPLYCKGDESFLVTGRTDFMFIKERHLTGYNNAVLSSVTVEECATACVSASSFICRSFDYTPSTCYLSEENDLTVVPSSDPPLHLFVRIMDRIEDPFTGPTPSSSLTTSSPPKSTSAGGSSSSIATVVGSAVGAIVVIVIVIVLIIVFYKRRSNESATTKSEGKESDSSPQYENPVFDQSQTDVLTYQDPQTEPHTYQDRNNDDTADPHTYEDQEANSEESNDAIKRDYFNVPGF
ncbi:uncharacterized protein LOC115924452 [Strongylocentrotus purpuratus]|uniref:Apple domain-containing protein n=1 Tax=Strongylocentrotus purpuratus TaxID=7668 RepID=A0A7M7SZD1_STRPU|nr:uncharacterized protein LOC115924452 [Strongylocentrotus purpuratus]